MTLIHQLANLLTTTKSIKFQMMPHESIEGQIRLLLVPIHHSKFKELQDPQKKTQSGQGIEKIEAALSTPLSLTGTADELAQLLPATLDEIANARAIANDNLTDLLKRLKTKPTSKIAKEPASKATKDQASISLTPTSNAKETAEPMKEKPNATSENLESKVETTAQAPVQEEQQAQDQITMF